MRAALLVGLLLLTGCGTLALDLATTVYKSTQEDVTIRPCDVKENCD